MLILRRRAGESIHIGPNVVVTFVRFERNRAHIGIEAPPEIPVDRKEVAQAKANGEPPPAQNSDEEDGDSAEGDHASDVDRHVIKSQQQTVTLSVETQERFAEALFCYIKTLPPGALYDEVRGLYRNVTGRQKGPFD